VHFQSIEIEFLVVENAFHAYITHNYSVLHPRSPYPVLIEWGFPDRVVARTDLFGSKTSEGLTAAGSSNLAKGCCLNTCHFEQEQEHEQERGEAISQQALVKLA
jgi:hypothetical protein